MAGDPRPGPPLAEVLAGATWLRVDPPVGPDASPELVDPPRLASEDGHFGQHVLKLKRAAFGTHVVRRDESGPIDEREMKELEIDRPPAVVLVGPGRTCVATPGNSRVVVLDDFGRELELRHELTGCGPGPHAPLGLLAERIPIQLAWIAARCSDAAAEWTKAVEALGPDVEAPLRVGRFVFGKDTAVHVLASQGALHLVIATEKGAPRVLHLDDETALDLGVVCEPPADG
jgi:hypothetical protein